MNGLRMSTIASFPDGNAIIIADNDVFFKIHKGALALHCPVLAAKLEGSPEVIDGCPVVRVTDTPYDMEQVLRLVYGLFKFDSITDVPFTVRLAWVRVGTKYGMEELIAYAAHELERLYPTSLRGWDGLMLDRCRYRWNGQLAIEGLTLFQETRQVNLIPAALYRCTQLDPSVVRTGATRVDGTRVTLSPENIDLVLRTKERLKAHGARMIEEAWEIKRDEACVHKWASDICEAVLDALAYTLEDGKEAWRDGDPLSTRFLDYVEKQQCEREFLCPEDFDEQTACGRCIGPVCDWIAAVRGRVWKELPEMAGVQDKVEYWD